MTTAKCTYSISSVHVIGDLKIVKAAVSFTPYATNGIACAPSTFGLVEFFYSPVCGTKGDVWYTYDGTTLKAWTDADSQMTDNTNSVQAEIIVIGK